MRKKESGLQILIPNAAGLQIRQSGDRTAVHHAKQAEAHFSALNKVRVSPCLSVAK